MCRIFNVQCEEKGVGLNGCSYLSPRTYIVVRFFKSHSTIKVLSEMYFNFVCWKCLYLVQRWLLSIIVP